MTRTTRLSALTLAATFALSTAALHSQTVGQDLKGAGQDTAAATRTAAHDTKKGTVKAYDKTKQGTTTAAHDTKKGTVKAYDKTKQGTRTVAHDTKKDTVKAYDKTADGTKDVAHKLDPH